MIGIGVMSGTSLDGIDIAICKFINDKHYNLLDFHSRAYSKERRESLKNAHLLSGFELQLLENEYSNYLAERIVDFIQASKLKIDFIACHGHTVFHRPEIGLTHQIANGGLIAQKTGITTVCDFRRSDVAQGGQGAPLVPIGDSHLFGEYAACLNLGGFANVSYTDGKNRIAYDISPANILLNHLASREGLEYDKNGDLAAKGKPDISLLEKLNALDFYKKEPPKSLGREWVETEIFPLLNQGNTLDLLATCIEHIGMQIGLSLSRVSAKGSVLATGGGVYNSALIRAIERNNRASVYIPDAELIEGKEAIIFAFLGYLRMQKKINIPGTHTGGRKDICSGAVYHSM